MMTTKQRIVEYLKGCQTGTIARTIAAAVGAPEPSVRRCLLEMETKRQVVPSFENGDPHTYWSITATTA